MRGLSRAGSAMLLGILGLTLLAAPFVAVGQVGNSTPPAHLGAGAKLELVAEFPDRQITGVAVTETGRIFVNLPRWTTDVSVSVGELKNGRIIAYPDGGWNGWRNAAPLAPEDHFICVQSVVADGHGNLWALDPAAPAMSGPVKDGPKLVRIRLRDDHVERVYRFSEKVAPPGSYLNDVRFSPDGQWAYLSDSGVKGALVVLDTRTGSARRVLDGDPSTQFDPSVKVQVEGHELRRPDGRGLDAGADGITVSPDGKWLYWQALRGRTLYRIGTGVLRDPGLAAADLSRHVERVAQTHPTDGLWMDSGGELYVSNPETNGIEQGRPGAALMGLLTDSRLRWPDSFAQGPDGTLFITSSHIQDSPWFKPESRTTPSELWKIVGAQSSSSRPLH